MVRASLGGIGFSNDGGQNYQNAITGQGIWATAITVGKIVASQLDITGTASFYADEYTDAYGILIMPDKGNIFDRDLGYCRIDKGNTYFIGGEYTDILFGPNASISEATSIKTEVEANDNTYAPTTDGYIFLTGWDNSSTVDVSQGDAIVGGWRPWNPVSQAYDEFRKLWRITTNGEAYLKDIHLSTVAGEGGSLELTDGDTHAWITPYTPICLAYSSKGMDRLNEWYRLWNNGRLEFDGYVSGNLAKTSGPINGWCMYSGNIDLPSRRQTPIFKGSSADAPYVNLTCRLGPYKVLLSNIDVYDGNVMKVEILTTADISSVAVMFCAHMEGQANPNAFPEFDF